MHLCFGNIAIVIRTTADKYQISYDHGIGICQIGKDIGFVSLNSQSCKKLNSYLLSKGFTKGQIGCN